MTVDRYLFLELSTESRPVGIIRDNENEDAWVRSSLYVPVER